MRYSKLALALVLPVTLTAAACSPNTEKAPANGASTNSASDAQPAAINMAQPTANASEQETAARPIAQSNNVIGLEGLGDLRVGQAVPKGSSWAERGAQEGSTCSTVSSPDYPGVYGMVIEGKVRRITVGQRSGVKLTEGIGIGSPERDVQKWFAGFRVEPHKYEAAPAKYLTAPNAASGDAAVRFEIGGDGKVKFIHVGMMPELAYVEGCG